MRRIPLVLTALAVALPALRAQTERQLSTPTGYVVLSGVDANTISNQISQGFRLTDIEVRTASPLTYVATFVSQSGAYNEPFWWYVGITSTQLATFLSNNNAYLTDLEPYDDGNGNTRFACIMKPTSGGPPGWYYYFNTTTSYIGTQIGNNNARLIDLDEYTIGGNTYYSAVAVVNSGSWNRGWWWYLNVSAAQVSSFTNANNARITDLERRSNGNFNVVMQADPGGSPYWGWWYGLTLSDIIPTLEQAGHRPIDIETYVSGLTRYYVVVSINNKNAATTAVGNAMRSRTDGTVGAWLQRINGTTYVDLNQGTVFEPASTMKTLHHVHTMRRINVSASYNLSTMINVYTGLSGSCPQDTGPINESLQTVLQDMMENSDNNRTQAIRAHFGDTALNATATALGMGSTSSNHRLGCGGEALSNPNEITLYDLSRLHTEVANGYLGIYRDTFYTLMLDSINDLSVNSVINQEAASIGGISSQALSTFKNNCRLAHKGGNYILNDGTNPTFYHRAEFGFLRLPFISSNNIVDQEYTFGAFVNDSHNDSNAVAAIYTDAIPEMLRPRIRAALQTWVGAQATSVAYGSGCQGMTHTLSGLPRINSSMSFLMAGGHASSTAMLALGTSTTSHQGVPLPASLVPYGGAPGCVALCDLLVTATVNTNAAGSATIPLAVPNDPLLLGFIFRSQYYSLGPSVRSSNARTNEIGY